MPNEGEQVPPQMPHGIHVREFGSGGEVVVPTEHIPISEVPPAIQEAVRDGVAMMRLMVGEDIQFGRVPGCKAGKSGDGKRRGSIGGGGKAYSEGFDNIDWTKD